MPDYFTEQLLGCEWRGIPFPVTAFRVRLSHDIAQHKRPDQDGARVESTGRNPLVFSAQIPFRNGIRRGPNESWVSGTLYTEGWRRFLDAMADRSKGMLQHPALGRIQCKPVSADSELTAQKRDGEDVTAEWIEFSDDEAASNAILAAGAPVGQAVTEAANLDTILADLAAIKAKDPDYGKISLEEAMRRVAGVVDTVSLMSRKTFGMIDRIGYRLNAIGEAIKSAQDPQNWAAKESINRLRAALHAVKQQALKAQKDTRFYIVPNDTTLASLAPRLSNKVTDLVRLNPALVSAPMVTRSTAVRYFVTI